MSGYLTPEQASAAMRHAHRAEQSASGLSWPEFVRRKARTYGRPATERDSLPARTWRAMELAVRTAFVMLALDTAGDPRELAGQSWDAFSDADKRALAATARTFQANTQHARSLW